MERERLRAEVEALHTRLEEARAASRLPEQPTAFEALDELVTRTRLSACAGADGREAVSAG